MTTCGLCQQTLYDEWWMYLHVLTTHDHQDVLATPELAMQLLSFMWPIWTKARGV